MLGFANNSRWQWHAICMGQWHMSNLPIYRFNPFLTNYLPSNMAFACFLFLLLVIMNAIVCFLFRDYWKRILCIVEMLCAFLVFSSWGLPGKNSMFCTLLCASTYWYKRPLWIHTLLDSALYMFCFDSMHLSCNSFRHCYFQSRFKTLCLYKNITINLQ